MKEFAYYDLDWDKSNGLVPAIIQDSTSGKVLMLGFMNEEALQKTLHTKKITFFSRTRKALWTKGETSGNYLILNKIMQDCDNDALLILATPMGPTCHTGDQTCFKQEDIHSWQVIQTVESVIAKRINEMQSGSYTVSLVNKGINKIAQKVGEEAIETVIAGLNESDDKLCEEIADLMYHILVLLAFRKLSFEQVLAVLNARMKQISIPNS